VTDVAIPASTTPARGGVDRVGPAPTLPHPIWPFAIFSFFNVVMGLTIALFCRLVFKPEAVHFANQIIEYLLATVLVLVPLDLLVIYGWFLGPYRRVRVALMRSVSPLDMQARDVRRTLLLPIRMLAVALVQWIVLSLGWSLLALDLEVKNPWGTMLLTTASGFCFGHIAAVLCFYGQMRFGQRLVSPQLLGAGSLAPVGHFRPIRVYHHVILLIVTLGVVQPALSFSMLDGNWVDLQRGLLFVSIMTVAVSTVQGLGMLAALARPAGNLDGRMSDVAQGDLSVLARIDNLDTFGRLASTFNEMVEGLRQRERVQELFGRYVTQQVADTILAGDLALGGELRTATVLFSDIRGFTRMSERMAPEDVVTFLNQYLDLMVDCVLEAGGTLDKFIGDAVMAVFGVPLSAGEAPDAEAAVRCALAMSARLDELNAQRAARHKAPIEIGIGLHTGPLVAGNIGSAKRMEYTVIGDTVNLTSRLEGLTKTLSARIVASAATVALLPDGFQTELMQELAVRGRDQKVQVFAVRAGPEG
jgi:class 3 adenylate cyclase